MKLITTNKSLKEDWVAVKGFEGIYEVSSQGRVKSLDRIITTKNGVERKVSEKILSLPINGEGYQRISLHNEGAAVRVNVHQLVAQHFLGHTPNGMKSVIDHLNNDKTDNRIENLNITTQRDNVSRLGGSSKYVGVYLSSRAKRWISQIRVDGRKFYLGSFKDELDAARTYQEALQDIDTYLAKRNNLKTAV